MSTTVRNSGGNSSVGLSALELRVRWLRINWPSTTTMLEIPLVMLVISGMALASARGSAHLQQSLAALNAFSLAQGAELAQMEYRAVTGEWPDSNSQAAYSEQLSEKWIRDASIRAGGAVDFTFSDRMPAMVSRVLSFRAWQAGEGTSPIVWVCGRARALPLAPGSADRTTIADAMLPSPCRGR